MGDGLTGGWGRLDRSSTLGLVDIDYVEGQVAHLPHGHQRAALAVEPINLALQGEPEQDQVWRRYRQLLTSLGGPISIYSWSRPDPASGDWSAPPNDAGPLERLAGQDSDFRRQPDSWPPGPAAAAHGGGVGWRGRQSAVWARLSISVAETSPVPGDRCDGRNLDRAGAALPSTGFRYRPVRGEGQANHRRGVAPATPGARGGPQPAQPGNFCRLAGARGSGGAPAGVSGGGPMEHKSVSGLLSAQGRDRMAGAAASWIRVRGQSGAAYSASAQDAQSKPIAAKDPWLRDQSRG